MALLDYFRDERQTSGSGRDRAGNACRSWSRTTRSWRRAVRTSQQLTRHPQSDPQIRRWSTTMRSRSTSSNGGQKSLERLNIVLPD